MSMTELEVEITTKLSKKIIITKIRKLRKDD